jgi:hypothetical protein
MNLPQSDALRGSVELLVLKTLSLDPMHGWGIGQRVQQMLWCGRGVAGITGYPLSRFARD